MPSFEVKKDSTRWIIAGTGSGWELIPRESNAIICCLNDYIHVEKYGVKMDYLVMMDILDEKPQIVTGQDNLREVIKRINDLQVPFIAPMRYEEIPLSRAFPLDEAVKRFGAPYFSNTICYQICFAILNGAKEIDIYGVNQASSSEYGIEKAGVEYWLGICNGLGIKITIHGDKSELLTNKTRWGAGVLYGYNADYQNIIRDKERFGEAVIKKLLTPPRNVSRTVRAIN